MTAQDAPEPARTPTGAEAQQLLASVPPRPRRQLMPVDHLCALATVTLSLTAGLLSLGGHPLWAILPALGALVTSHTWITKRQHRANEPRLNGAALVTTVFTAWLLIPVWRGVTRGETIPFPEAWLFAGLAPAAWLVYYIILLIRR